MQLTLGWGSLNALVTNKTQEAREGGLMLVHVSKVKEATVTEMYFLLFSSGLQHMDRTVPLTCSMR